MPKPYRRELASSLRAELKKLAAGNKAEQQRCRNAQDAILKVLADPLNREFSKALPDGYKAVDVLQQYRLFFKIIDDSLVEDPVVFFVWINSEDSLHRTGKADDCYDVFRAMVGRGEIETYQPVTEPERRYKLHGTWKEPVVYVSYKRTTPGSAERADSHLHLNQVTAKEYRIEAITVSAEDCDLASELLDRLCADADVAGVTLTHELFMNATNADKSRHLLKKFDFSNSETLEDVELWVRTPESDGTGPPGSGRRRKRPPRS